MKEGHDAEGCGEVWKPCVLTKKGTENKDLHTLARNVRGMEFRYGKELGIEFYSEIFGRWEDASRPFLQEGRDYWVEFLAKLNSVESPTGVLLSNTFKLTKNEPPHEKLMGERFRSDIQHFANFCRAMHVICEGGPILLAQVPISVQFGCHQSTVSNWIKALVTLGILKLEKKGYEGGGASTYFYIG